MTYLALVVIVVDITVTSHQRQGHPCVAAISSALIIAALVRATLALAFARFALALTVIIVTSTVVVIVVVVALARAQHHEPVQ